MLKYIDDFCCGRLAGAWRECIAVEVEPQRTYRLMAFCGGHTHAIFRIGLADLLPTNIEMVHGPGCPVCVLPMARIDTAIEFAMRPGAVLCAFGDMLRLPGSTRRSLLRAKDVAGVHMVCSAADGLAVARTEPACEVAFLAIGLRRRGRRPRRRSPKASRTSASARTTS